MPFVYTERRSAEIWADQNREEWAQYKVEEVDVRELTADEGAIGPQLVAIRRESADRAIQAMALKKLTEEEIQALGLQNTNALAPGSAPKDET